MGKSYESKYSTEKESISNIEDIFFLEEIPNELFRDASKTREKYFDKELRFYYPKPRFPSVSVTGTECALECKHCGGHFLSGMDNVDTPLKLKDFSTRLEEEGGVGILISGGSDITGRVPLDRYYKTLSWIKDNTTLIVNVHTGLLNKNQAEELASAGVDIVSIDVVGSNETIKRVYGLDANVEDYLETMNNLLETKVKTVVPHICVGLDFGKIIGEAKALDMIRQFEPEIIVLLGLIPTKGTKMENIIPPSSEDMMRMVLATRLSNPRSSIAIGCMRPKDDKIRMDRRVLRAGVDRIVLPSKSILEEAIANGFKIKKIHGCCAIPISLEQRALKRG
jgi:uncharacterized radical SAM superfamily protein